MTAEQTVHVVDRFNRDDAGRDSGGTSLGVAIVAAIVTALTGEFVVESSSVAGSRFTVGLPLAKEVDRTSRVQGR